MVQPALAFSPLTLWPLIRTIRRTLWDALRECRRRIAAEHGVPPYVIFHDATRLQIVETKPETDAELLALSGVGMAKLEKYGAEFPAAVSAHES